MISKPICLAGDGWGVISAYKSLKGTFENIDLLTNDPNLKIGVNSNHNLIDKFQKTNAQIIVCSGYRPIIEKEQLLTKQFINIHYSLLPKYRGQHSTVWAILNDEEELGLTIHLMNEFIDDGPIIYQHSVENDYISTSVFYMKYLNAWIENNLGKIIVSYLNGQINPVIQNKELATWVGRRKRNDCKIDFSREHRYLINFFRALVPPYPLPYIEIEKESTKYSIGKAIFIERKINTNIGRILNIDDDGVYVSSRDGYVILNQILDSNSKVIDFNNFKIGTYLNQTFR